MLGNCNTVGRFEAQGAHSGLHEKQFQKGLKFCGCLIRAVLPFTIRRIRVPRSYPDALG